MNIINKVTWMTRLKSKLDNNRQKANKIPKLQKLINLISIEDH